MTAITFDVLARDHASAVNRKIGESFDALDAKVTRFGHRLAASVGVAFSAEKIVEFGKASVDAFEKAQAGERRLADAFDRFPKLADTNLAALRRLNDGIEARTGFLSRDVAAGEANLAQFKLTGRQLQEITPLLVDYADKTGQDIPEAATLLGRALLGNQRALKSIGIALPTVTASAKDMAKAHREVETSTTALARAQEHLKIMEADLAAKRKVTAADELRYTDAQNAVRDAYAKNQAALAALRSEQDKTAKSGSYFDQVVTGLRSKVGGFADKESQSAQGQVRKLRAEFDQVEVKIGAQLLPKLLDLGHFLTGTFIPDLEATGRFLQRNEDVIVPLAKVVGTLGGAIIVTNKATKIWEASSKAVTTWTRLLGNESVTTAGKIGTVGAAGVSAQAKVVTATEAGTTAIEAEGAAAVTTAGKIGVAGRAAAGLLASLQSAVPLVAALANEGGANKRVTDYLKSHPGAASAFTGKPTPAPSTPFSGVDPTLAALLGTPSYPSDGKGTDLPARGTANRVLAASIYAAQTSQTAKKTKDILAGLPQFAVGSGYGIAEGIAKGIREREQKALAAAKSLASKLQQQIGSINSTLSGFKDSVAGTILGNASVLNTGNQTAAGIINFERHQLSIDRTFQRNLALMAKRGFAASYISQLAQAGPEQAGNIAAQLATATVGEVNAANRYAREIGVSAQATAANAAQAVFPKLYAESKKQTAELVAVKQEIAKITTDLETLARTGHLQTKVTR